MLPAGVSVVIPRFHYVDPWFPASGGNVIAVNVELANHSEIKPVGEVKRVSSLAPVANFAMTFSEYST
jgi:hypothetical protein